jgi:predicted glycogen debranching enzyme
MDASVDVDGQSTSLATHQFPGVGPTNGYANLVSYAQDPLPRWVYDVRGSELEQTLALARGHNVLVLRYVWRGARPAQLTLRPLLAMRPFHCLVREHGAMIQRVEMRQHEVSVRPVPALPRLVFRHRGVFVGSPDWWRRFEYLVEQVRGHDFQEDLWSPGVFRVRLDAGATAYLTCGLDDVPEHTEEQLLEQAADALRACDPGTDRALPVRRLWVATELFRADLAHTPSVVTGYPCSGVWGRCTLLAVPGLYLVQGRVEDAKRVVAALIGSMRRGLIPSRIPDDGSSNEFHGVDASLLLFPVARRMAACCGVDDPYVRDVLLPAMREVFETILRGTSSGIRVTDQGLLAADAQGTPLTWMGARVAGGSPTSRAGLPVEVQALWSKACDDLAWVTEQLGDLPLARRAAEARDRARAAFRERFWCQGTQYPYDVVSADNAPHERWEDSTVRPNAVVALAVDSDLFTPSQAKAIVDRAQRDLLTPAGLRSLSPHDPDYMGRQTGTSIERNRASHQGTAWPFLLGAFCTAMRHAYPTQVGRHTAVQAQIEAMLSNASALGQVPEVADGDPPHRPDGCVAHAVGVGELLRVFVEELGM